MTAAAVTGLAADLECRIARLTRLLRAQSVRSGLSLTALSVLRRLDQVGPCRVTDLASAEAVAQPTMTALVSRLQTRGLVARAGDPADGRAVLVSLTSAGGEQLAAVRADRIGLLDAHLGALDPDSRAALAAALPALDLLLEPDIA